MPNRLLTPEEYQQVVDRAVKTAPEGLSESQFNDVVDTAVQHEEAAKAASVRPAGADIKADSIGVLKGFLSGAGNAVKGLWNAGTTNPLTTVGSAVKSQLDQFGKSGADVHQGRYVEGLGHAVAGLLPIVGPAAADIGERIAESGDVGAGVGEGAMLSLLSAPTVAGSALSKTGRGVENIGRVTSGGRIGSAGRYAGAAGALFHGNPMIAAGLAAPDIAQFAGRGMQRVGSAMESLRAGPNVSNAGEWLDSVGEASPEALAETAAVRGARLRRAQGIRQSQEVPYRAGSGTSDAYSEQTPPLDIRADSWPSNEPVYGDVRPELENVDLARAALAKEWNPKVVRRVIMESPSLQSLRGRK